MSRFYVTTAIDYANGDPHLGHAFEKIGADAIARYHRLRGDDVWFLIGMDEHGQKVAQTATERGIAPQQLADEIAATFQAMWDQLSISYDQFIRTTDRQHAIGVRALIERMFARNPDDFYEQSYQGWYCVGCELFKRENEIENGKCTLHPTRTLEWAEERNWFFRLTRYQSFLERLLADRPDFLEPESRRNEILALLAGGLEDISVTRSRLSWAIPFPVRTSAGEEQGTWVWFDALPNYLTATGFPDARYGERWPAQLHVIGKDIIRLHAVIWPAMLESAGLALPEHIWAHGFVQFGGERFSKSAGVALELGEAIDRFGADAFRYFLLREVPFDGDGNFSWERFVERYNADLANAFGNLASRTIAMIERYCDGIVPAWHPADGAPDDGSPVATLIADRGAYATAMDHQYLADGLAALWRSIAHGNEYVDHRAPWKLARNPAHRPELEETLATLAWLLAWHAVLVCPIMPAKAQELWTQLGAPGEVSAVRWAEAASATELINPSGWHVTRGAPLFPKEVAEKMGQ